MESGVLRIWKVEKASLDGYLGKNVLRYWDWRGRMYCGLHWVSVKGRTIGEILGIGQVSGVWPTSSCVNRKWIKWEEKHHPPPPLWEKLFPERWKLNYAQVLMVIAPLGILQTLGKLLEKQNSFIISLSLINSLNPQVSSILNLVRNPEHWDCFWSLNVLREFTECALSVLWSAPSCIDHIEVIWSEHCDTVRLSENFTKLPAGSWYV